MGKKFSTQVHVHFFKIVMNSEYQFHYLKILAQGPLNTSAHSIL